MADIDVLGYLRRLGLEDAAEPSVEGLFALHRAHVERVAYTSLQIHLGQRTSPAPDQSAARIVAGESGYCYHLNGAFSLLLEALGYDVLWHRGRVWHVTPEFGDQAGPIADEPNHLPLTVEVEDREFLVDCGLGDSVYEPIPLEAGTYDQGLWTFTLEPTVFESGKSGWSFRHDPAADSFTGMVFEERIASLPDFTARHDWMETSPESNFVKKLDFYRRERHAVDSMRGIVLKRRTPSGTTERELTSRGEWLDAVGDVFGLHMPGVSQEARELLYARTVRSHEAWIASQD